MRSNRPVALAVALLGVVSVALVATCAGPEDVELGAAADHGHDHRHGHDHPTTPWGEGVELISRQLISVPQIDFNPRPNLGVDQSGNPIKNVIGLTFDDGPDLTNTPRVLDTLKAKNVKATFFINTNNWDGPVDSNTTLKNLIKRIIDEGHQLGSHTVTHPHLPTLSDSAIRGEIEGVQTTVNRSDVLGAAFPKLTMLRAPFGDPYLGPGADFDRVAAIVAQYAVHMGWAVDTFDYNCSGTAAQKRDCVINNFTSKVKTPGNGDYGMVLMHSVQPQTADAIGAIIDYCRNNGFQFWVGEQFVQAQFGKSSNEVIFGTPPTCTQTPFGGTSRAIPGTVQAEDFDNGGNNCAYKDTTAGNNGNSYRTNVDVDIQPTGDAGAGHNVGWVAASEYLDYTVNVTASGNYKLELRTAATATGKTVDVSVGGTLIANDLAIPNTGAFQTYATVTVPSVALTAGTKELKVLFNQSSVNLNWIRITAVGGCTPENDAEFCSRLGKTCGAVSGTDNCGAPRSVGSCGTCSPPATCSASNVCQGGAQSFFFEAENGNGASTPPMVVVNDANASGAKCIWSGTAGSNGSVPTSGHVTFTFNVTTAATFKVWGRFLVGPSTSSDDSLWVRMDQEPVWKQWNDIFPRVGNGGYRWDAEHDTLNGNAVITRNLAPGTHTLEVAYRENGLKMDRFLVTSDLSLVPSS